MTADHYIYVTAAALECYRHARGGLALAASIATPRGLAVDSETLDESVQQFEAHLDRFPYDRFFVITDTQAEAYQAETIPALSRRDLRMLLTRKLEQRYRTTPYRSVVPHRKRPYAFIRNLIRRRARTTTRILYALTGPETLAPWLGALEQRDLDVRGIYSLGALMPALMALVKLPPHADALFVLRTAAGYRHAFVAPAGLRFSRLCAYANAGETQVGQEIDKTLQYLTMARLWGVEGRKRALHIVVIDSQPGPISLAVPGEGLRSAELIQMHPRQIASTASAELLDSTNSAWLLLNRAANAQHGVGCASDLPILDASRRARYRRAALCATLLAAALSGVYLVRTGYVIRENIAQAHTEELIAGHVNAQAASSERAEPNSELQPEQLRAVVQTRDRLLARNISAYGVLQRIAAALAPFPDLDVDRLDWSYAGARPAEGAPAAGVQPDAGSLPSDANTIFVHIGGHVGGKPLKSDANAAVAQMAAALARELRGRQSVEKWPYDVAADGTLASKLHDADDAKTDFSVTVAVPQDLDHAS
jgi:hypothetical protein